MKLAVVLFNLGGPDTPEAVERFLANLFSDPAIISIPGRRFIGRLIAARRGPVARAIYAQIGGRSPILEETEAQARALESVLAGRGHDVRAFVAMRYWRPFCETVARAVAAWRPDTTVLLPLYPQYSTTTTASSFAAWRDGAAKAGLGGTIKRVCCYPRQEGFVGAAADRIREAWARRKQGLDYRLLLSAHGLPKRMIGRGDPYRWQVEQSAAAVIANLGIAGLDWRLCYQSRVGPLAWIEPATAEEIRGAAMAGKGLVVAPLAFVSEHSETLVELDIEYRRLAEANGGRDYIRVPAVGTARRFIGGLADLVERAVSEAGPVTDHGGRICPDAWRSCGFENEGRG